MNCADCRKKVLLCKFRVATNSSTKLSRFVTMLVTVLCVAFSSPAIAGKYKSIDRTSKLNSNYEDARKGKLDLGKNADRYHYIIVRGYLGQFLPGYFKPGFKTLSKSCLLYTSPSPRDQRGSRMPSSA